LTTPPTIVERTLDNGLRIILRESHDAPVASFWVWYRVGARNETPGLTGVSHWVEHMQFKGTPSFGKGEIFADISRNGGFNNAMTSNDWTAYYETLPADRLSIAIRIEADRMSNSLFDPAETESERTVILSEQQGAENNPPYLLYKEVAATAFKQHPYGTMVIGQERDLRSMTRDNLYGHYKRAYTPNNAFVVAAGDFDASAVFAQVEQSFGAIPSGEPLAPLSVVEPPQTEERRVTLRRPSPTAYLRIGYRAPAGDHPDTAALLVADAILSGAKGMGIAGGGPMGRSARLYRALVASGLARAAGSDFDFYVDPYLLIIGVTALPGADPATIESVLDAEIDRLSAEPVGDAEFARAVKQVKAQYVYSNEGVTNQAFWLGQMELIGSYRRAASFIDEIERVTPAGVLRVAKTYLTRSNRTVGWLLPSESGGGEGESSTETRVAVRHWGLNGPHAPIAALPSARRPFERRSLSNGAVLLGQAQPDDPALTIRIRFGAGSVCDPDQKEGLAALTARSLARGTAQRSFAEINEYTDALGASFGIDPSQLFADLRLRNLREDTGSLVQLAAEILRSPSFPADEVDKVRAEMLAAIKEQDADTRSVADRGARRLVYPAGHPQAHRVLGDPQSLAALTTADLERFHKQWFGPANMTVAAAGGFGSLDELAEILERAFAGWVSRAAAPSLDLAVPPPASTQRAGAEIPGKSQADVAIAFPVISRLDPGYHALEMANLILGRLGLMGRLGANVRDRQGLAYYAMSGIEAGRSASLWIARAGVDPANVERAIEGITHEVELLVAEPVSDAELRDAKSYSTGVLPLALETNDGIASLLLSIEQYDLGLDYLDRYPAIINALTAEELLAAAGANLAPNRLAFSVAQPA
jgi:zinc protease